MHRFTGCMFPSMPFSKLFLAQSLRNSHKWPSIKISVSAFLRSWQSLVLCPRVPWHSHLEFLSLKSRFEWICFGKISPWCLVAETNWVGLSVKEHFESGGTSTAYTTILVAYLACNPFVGSPFWNWYWLLTYELPPHPAPTYDTYLSWDESFEAAP